MPRRKTTSEPASVWDTVPAVVEAERLLQKTEERLAALPPTPTPESAQQAVVDAAVRALRTDGTPIPADIGERAVQAYTEALAPHAEYLALRSAVNSLKRRLPFLRAQGATLVLEALAVRLDDVLTEVRAIVARSGHLTGDAAIKAGGTAIADYLRLTELVSSVDEIRREQRAIYAGVGDIGVLSATYKAGHDQFRDVGRVALPRDVKEVIEGKRPRDIPFLIFMAESGRTWLATSVDELTDEAADVDDIDEPTSYRQHIETVPEPSAPTPSRI